MATVAHDIAALEPFQQKRRSAQITSLDRELASAKTGNTHAGSSW
jgi:hypothetical protein